MDDCLFCKIAKGEIPATILYQDERVIAFDDRYPKAPIHKLIIPRKHIATLNDITPEDNELLGQMFWVAKNLAAKYGIAEAGYRTLFNCNAAAGQVIFHIHLHLLGGRDLTCPPG